jgi:hypothetical protein
MGFSGSDIRQRVQQQKAMKENPHRATIFRYCPHCDAMVDDHATSCQACGMQLPEQPTTPPDLIPQRAEHGERKAKPKAKPAVIVGLLLFIAWAYSHWGEAPSSPTPASQPHQQLTHKQAERERRMAEWKAKKEVEDAQCRQSLQCWGDRNSLIATMNCKGAVEGLAKYTYEWTDGFFESKFSRFRWQSEAHGGITYIGDKIRFQNGFGAWQHHIYECDFDTLNKTVLMARAYPGRLR